MPDSTIDNLPPASTLTGSEPLPAVQTGTDVKITLGQIAAFAAAQIPNATASIRGMLTAADKAKLDGIAAGATVNLSDASLLSRVNHTGTQTASTISDLVEAIDDRVAALLQEGPGINLTYNDGAGTLTIESTATGTTNLGSSSDATSVTVTSSTGTDATLVAATTSNAGVMSAADKTKLNGIASGATANSSDATLLARANHTGTQTASTISDLTAAVNALIMVFAASLANASNAAEGDALIAFKRTATAAVASTLHQWHEKQVLNLAADCGVVFDDSTDNTAAFASVSTYLNTVLMINKPSLYVPFGIAQTDGFDVPNDVTIFGDGWGNVIKQRANAGRAFFKPIDTTLGNHRVTLRNFCLDGNKANQPENFTGYSMHAINIDGPCTGWKIQGMKIMNSQGHGTQIRGGGPLGQETAASDIEISGCWYYECGYYDVGATNGRESVYANQAQNLRIINNLMENSGRQTIAFEGSTTNSAIASRKTIVGYNILRNAKSGAGIDDEANSGGEHIFIGNLITGMTGAGVRFVGTTGRTLVALNTIVAPQGRGIDGESRASPGNASVHVLGNILDGPLGTSINLNNANRALVADNTLLNSTGIAINVRVASGDQGTRVCRNLMHVTGQEAIVFDRFANGPHITDNVAIDVGSVAFPSAAFSIRSNATFSEAVHVRGNSYIETRGTSYCTNAYVFSNLNRPIISDNSVQGATLTVNNDVLWASSACTNVMIGRNQWDPARVSGAPASYADSYEGSVVYQGRVVGNRVTVTYSASMTFDATKGNTFVITASDGTAFTINNPTGLIAGQRVKMQLKNTHVGALGTITFGSFFKNAGAFVAPASGTNKSIEWEYDGSLLHEAYRTSADVSNT